MKRIGQLFGTLVVVLGFLGAVTAWWAMRPLTLANQTVDISIEPQTTVRGIAQVVADAGVDVEPVLLYGFFRLSGQSRKLRAGSYEISEGESLLDLLRKLSRGEESLKAVGLIDGWTFKQFRAALAKAPNLNHDSQGLSDAELMARLGKPGVPPEGHFFPDTYTYGKGASELRVMERALHAMDKQLAAAWAQRDTSIILKSPDEALILASIVEKETGKESDRGMISSVFHNRLRINMPLQTDPTVIYGMGDAFDGNLRRADLLSDHPWNTYTRKGLPPTPIAMPGRNALRATMHPDSSKALYFVARGDGSSVFSETLEAHNAAVNRYQRGGAIQPSNGAQAK
jgi:UPF0755 protein